MNSQLVLIFRCMLLAGLMAGFTGCKCCKTKSSGANTSSVSGSSSEVINPDGSSGSLAIGVNAFASNPSNLQCFPSSQGWDKYYPMPKFFLGPGVTPTANSYTNANNIASVTVQTCDPLNGTILETGIVIQNSINPSDKVCVTNSPACGVQGAKLTINTRSLANNTKYKATIYYKSSTLGSLTNVVVTWSYP